MTHSFNTTLLTTSGLNTTHSSGGGSILGGPAVGLSDSSAPTTEGKSKPIPMSQNGARKAVGSASGSGARWTLGDGAEDDICDVESDSDGFEEVPDRKDTKAADARINLAAQLPRTNSGRVNRSHAHSYPHSTLRRLDLPKAGSALGSSATPSLSGSPLRPAPALSMGAVAPSSPTIGLTSRAYGSGLTSSTPPAGPSILTSAGSLRSGGFAGSPVSLLSGATTSSPTFVKTHQSSPAKVLALPPHERSRHTPVSPYEMPSSDTFRDFLGTTPVEEAGIASSSADLGGRSRGGSGSGVGNKSAASTLGSTTSTVGGRADTNDDAHAAAAATRRRPPMLNPQLFPDGGSQLSAQGLHATRPAQPEGGGRRRSLSMGGQALGPPPQVLLPETTRPAPVSLAPQNYACDSDDVTDVMRCSVMERYLRLTPLSKQAGISPECTSSEGDTGPKADSQVLCFTFLFSSKGVDLTTKMRLRGSTTAAEAKQKVVNKLCLQHGWTDLNSEQVTLKICDPSVKPSEYLYGPSPLDSFAYVAKKGALASRGGGGDHDIKISVVPLSAILEVTSGLSPSNPSGAQASTICVRSKSGKNVKLRRKSCVGSSPKFDLGDTSRSQAAVLGQRFVSTELLEKTIERSHTGSKTTDFVVVKLTFRHHFATGESDQPSHHIDTFLEELIPVPELLRLSTQPEESGRGVAPPAARLAEQPCESDDDDFPFVRSNNSFSYNAYNRATMLGDPAPASPRDGKAGGAAAKDKDGKASPLGWLNRSLRPENTGPPEATAPATGRPRSQTTVGSPGRRRGFTESGLVIARGLVSKKKIRYKDKGYDLDLTYITPHIIAMGYPSLGTEAYYRNKMEDVNQFFETNHPAGYHIYNLCKERTYEYKWFKGRVTRYPFYDHCPPPLHQIMVFCADVQQFLAQGEEKVVSIHCKAGKGRTGTMIAAYLMYSGQANSADEALEIFGSRRTSDGKGVTIPSQIRYVHYFESLLTCGEPKENVVLLESIKLCGIPHYRDGGCDPYFTIHKNTPEAVSNEKLYDSRDGNSNVKYVVSSRDCDLKLHRVVVIRGDVQIQMFQLDRSAIAKSQKMFQVFFNTSFLDARKEPKNSQPPSKYQTLRFTKAELDKAAKDKDCKYFDDNFAVCCTHTHTHTHPIHTDPHHRHTDRVAV